MKLVRNKPVALRDLEDMSARLARMGGLPSLFEDGDHGLMREWKPSCDIGERPDAYEVHAELPGVAKEDVHVTVEHGVLTIEGEKKQAEEKRASKLYRTERFRGHFLRRFALPEDADADRIEARFVEGVLDVVIPKCEGAKKVSIR